MLKPVDKKRAYEDIVQQVINLIKNGNLKQGDQLPSERDLTETLKVSRTTVQEAIRTLESKKLLQCRHGSGTYVISTKEEAFIQPLAAALFKVNDDIREIFYVRKIIEPRIAFLAAENATPKEIQEMEKILHEQEMCIRKGESVLETNSLFHIRLAGSTNNHVMERLLLAMVDLLKRSQEVHLVEEERDKRVKNSLEGHQRVLAAVKNGDSNVALKWMLMHLEDMEEIIFNNS